MEMIKEASGADDDKEGGGKSMTEVMRFEGAHRGAKLAMACRS